MSDDFNVSVIMTLVDRMSNRSRKITKSFDRMGKRGQKAMRMINSSALSAGRGLNRLGNRYSGVITAAVGGAAARNVMRMQRRLKTLEIQANKSADQMGGLREELFRTANMGDIKINPNELLDAIDKVVEKTGDLELAQRNMRNIGLSIRASGAAGGDIGALIADLSQKFEIKNDQTIFSTLDLLINQGKAGAFTLQNLATQGERVTAAYAATGRVGIPAVREMGAALQMIKQGTGSPEQAATAFEALLRTLNDAQKRKLLTKAGIRLMDPDDPNKLRSVTEIMKDIVKVTNGDLVKLSTIFDAEAMRALNAVATQFKQTGAFGDLDNFLNQSSDGASLLKDAANATDEMDAALESLGNTLKKYAFDKMSGPIKDLAQAINSIDPSKMEALLDAGIKGATFLAGAIVARKVLGAGVGIASGLKKTKGAAETLAGKLVPQPVFVVNFPRSLGGKGAGYMGGGGKAGVAGKAAGRAGRLARFGSKAGGILGKAALPIMVVSSAADIGMAALSGERSQMGGAVGRLGGGLAGAGIGAAAGSIVPVIGTAIGAAIGGVLGALGGGSLGEALARKDSASVDTGGTLHIKIDSEGQPQVTGSRTNDQRMNYEVDTGLVMGGAS